MSQCLLENTTKWNTVRIQSTEFLKWSSRNTEAACRGAVYESSQAIVTTQTWWKRKKQGEEERERGSARESEMERGDGKERERVGETERERRNKLEVGEKNISRTLLIKPLTPSWGLTPQPH